MKQFLLRIKNLKFNKKIMTEKIKVLLVEDDLVLSDMYTKKLEKENFEVVQAKDWFEWLTILQYFEPDAILLDIMMPNMDWFETLKAIKNQTSSFSKIFMFTNISDKKKIDEAMENWADYYIVKAETNPSDIAEKIKESLKVKNLENSPFYIKPGLNIFKMKNPYIEGAPDLEISVNIKI